MAINNVSGLSFFGSFFALLAFGRKNGREFRRNILNTPAHVRVKKVSYNWMHKQFLDCPKSRCDEGNKTRLALHLHWRKIYKAHKPGPAPVWVKMSRVNGV